MPDGTLLVIPVDNFEASGLLTNTKPEGVQQPVQFSPALEEIHSQSARYLKVSGPEKPKKLRPSAHGVDKCEEALAECETLHDCNEDRAIPLTASLRSFKASAVIFED